jgi:tetratricopeptide (TPR) repeat protein
MTAKRLLIGGAAAATTAAALLLGGVFGGGHTPAARALPTATVVARLDRRANAFAQRARMTADVAYYTRAAYVYRRALRLEPNDLPATIGLGALELSRHEFRRALVLGERAVSLSPTTAAGYGVVGDAQIELGQYGRAFATFDRMVALKPGVSSYARVSYARELRGDVSGAARAMRYAVDAAVGAPQALAWSHMQLGKLYWAHGRSAAAARELRAALLVQPHYPYALDALAQVEAARGRFAAALASSREAADVMPFPQFVANYGDILRAAGHPGEARRQYDLVGVIGRLERANHVNVDLELALFDIDHGVHLKQTLALARLAHAERPSIDGDDVLAWALARTGRCGEARPFSKRALRLGTQDATKFFHRGMIERCLGNRVAARGWFRQALALNPHFSLLWSPVARRYAS